MIHRTSLVLALAVTPAFAVGCSSDPNPSTSAEAGSGAAGGGTASGGTGGGTGDGGDGGSAGSGGAPDACAALSTRLQTALDADVADQKVPGGAAAVVLPGCTWSGVTGLSNKGAATPMKIDDQFFVASITKTFTAIEVLFLVGEGKIDLDDVVTQYVPTFQDASAITVRQLLNHTSGLYDYQSDPDFGAAIAADYDRVWTPDELLDFAAGKPSTNAPGTFHYSGTNTILAGLVIESASGSTVAQEFRARIIQPLALDSTYLAGFEREVSGSLAHGYNNGQDITSYYQKKGLPTASWTTGSMVSTISDVQRLFDVLLVQETLLAPAELAEMKTFVDTDALFKSQLHVPGYGLGLVERTTSIGAGIGNGGASSGWLSRSFFIADQQAMVTLFINSGTGDVDSTFDALVDVLARP